MSAQLVSIIVMFMSGITVGIVIDATRTIFERISNNFMRKFKFLAEWSVWFFLSISTFYLLFLIKGGQWRFIDPLAQVFGIVSYELLFQKITRFMGRVIVNIFIKPFYYIGHIFVAIIRKVIKILFAPIIFITNPIFKKIKKNLLKVFKSK